MYQAHQAEFSNGFIFSHGESNPCHFLFQAAQHSKK
jgi:hypothetical protein